MKKQVTQNKKSFISIVLFAAVCCLCCVLLFLLLWTSGEKAALKKQIQNLTTELEESRAEIQEVKAELEEAKAVPAATPEITKEPSEAPAPTKEPSPEPDREYLGNLEKIEAETLVEKEQVDWDHLGKYFAAYEISDELFERIYGDDRSYKTWCTIPREELRYIKVLHYGFDGEIHVGEVMVNAKLARDITEIFRELFENEYQIEKMYLVDNYQADDDLSCLANNTSAFNYRMITGGSNLSNHAFGCAIDINPVNNPYVTFSGGSPYVVDENAWEYIDRDPAKAKEKHMITHEDLCFKLFTEHGWTWGGDWASPIDYQHFEKSL